MSAEYMTEEQRKILCARIDAAAEKDIPASAWEHMRHRPYQVDNKKEGGECADREQQEEGVPVAVPELHPAAEATGRGDPGAAAE